MRQRRWTRIGMDNFTFGLTLTILGMSGTLISLWLLSLLISGLKKIYPIEAPAPAAGKEK
ncbi:MAG: hypothetical protein EXQ56_03715 [Acidobacteria bacterium]|nr:hypothetical protein [Acidobacteriota bacterium]